MKDRQRSATEAFLAAFGQAVLARREQQGLTQEEMGLESDLGQAYVSGVERGLRNPTAKSILAIAHALDTTPSALFKAAESRLRRR